MEKWVMLYTHLSSSYVFVYSLHIMPYRISIIEFSAAAKPSTLKTVAASYQHRKQATRLHAVSVTPRSEAGYMIRRAM
jgi:hypothetical protein